MSRVLVFAVSIAAVSTFRVARQKGLWMFRKEVSPIVLRLRRVCKVEEVEIVIKETG